ncbi:hypothetical protein [Nocardia sp. AG03]|uniref:hypothetical protein n=1 Tax=Nocardia sp. AG03 TaxID=3025312 RepID=UPI0024183397|nr:hypothetical protein [Nocardia sp. AG03]
MRNRPAFPGATAATLVPGRRPPLKMLPEPMAELLTRRDEINERLAVATKALAFIADDARDAEAAAEDDAAATAAALEGKAIPAPKAAQTLAAKRDKAMREHAAHTAALNAIGVECDTMRDDVKQARCDAYRLPDPRPELLAVLMPKVEAVIAELEAAAQHVALIEWWHCHPYDPRPVIWRDGAPVDIRATIYDAVNHLLTEEA